MRCKEVIRSISDYLDGELDFELVAEIELHIKCCHDCNVVVDTTRRTIEIYCGEEPLPLPTDVQERLETALTRHLRAQS